jgi:hypothetical protein
VGSKNLCFLGIDKLNRFVKIIHEWTILGRLIGGYMKKLFITVGLVGLLMGSVQRTHAVAEPATITVALTGAALCGAAGICKVVGSWGYLNFAGAGASVLVGGIAGYLTHILTSSAAIQKAWPAVYANSAGLTLTTWILVASAIATILTEEAPESPRFKKLKKYLFRCGATLGLVAGAMYIANANGKHILVGIEDIKPIKKGWFN